MSTAKASHKFVARVRLLVLGHLLVLYVVGLLALKWWIYPGWTWRGYLTDLKALSGLVGFAAVAWSLLRLYRKTTAEMLVQQAVTITSREKNLRLVVVSLSAVIATAGGALLAVGERSPAGQLLKDAEQSNWQNARKALAVLQGEPLRHELQDTFTLFVSVHELSERDLLKGSRSLREDRARVKSLLEQGYDIHLLNSLTFAELSKAIHFVEDGDGTFPRLQEGLNHLNSRRAVFQNGIERATIVGRMGELHLAGKNYQAAGRMFEEALEFEQRQVARARLRANLGNVYAATSDLATATELYQLAEQDYPEGRRSIFFSNFAYLLLLSKDYDLARRRVDQALQLDPSDWYSYLNRGLIKEATGDYDDAVADFQVVIKNSENPDSRREAQILAGRSLELASRQPSEYLSMYLAAAARSTADVQLKRVAGDIGAQAQLYDAMAQLLADTNTHAIEPFIEWFRSRAKQIRNKSAVPKSKS
jgi:tetratricopeptide (TPR) repeat protein